VFQGLQGCRHVGCRARVAGIAEKHNSGESRVTPWHGLQQGVASPTMHTSLRPCPPPGCPCTWRTASRLVCRTAGRSRPHSRRGRRLTRLGGACAPLGAAPCEQGGQEQHLSSCIAATAVVLLSLSAARQILSRHKLLTWPMLLQPAHVLQGARAVREPALLRAE
jgi:hypothetical protein